MPRQEIEGFDMDRELALRSLLFALVFYVLSAPKVAGVLTGLVGKSVDGAIVQALVFGLCYYLLTQYL